MLEILGEAGQGGMTQGEWFGRAKEVGIGRKREADCYDVSNQLKKKKLIYLHAERWFVRHGR